MAAADLRRAIGDALTSADWPHRDDGPPMAIGTSTVHDGRLVGGSIQPMDDIGLVRVIAFGEAGPPGGRLDEFHRLCGMVNPLLVDTTFEVDTDLAMPVCRATADEFRKQARLVDPASFGRHRSFLDTTA